MARVTLLHAADLDLDAPFEGIGRTPPPVAAALRDASLGAWEALVALALERRAAAVLVTGGVCAGLERGARAQARLRDGIARLTAAGVQVAIALGPRDGGDAFPLIADWPAACTVFPRGAVAHLPIVRDGVTVATVHGISARPHDLPAELAARLHPHGSGVQIAMLYAAAGETAPWLAPTADLPRGIAYWALGGSRGFARSPAGAPWVVYPGTPQGRGLGASECGAKGVACLEIAEGVILRPELAPIDRVRAVRVEWNDAADPAALVRGLSERAESLRAQHPGRGLVLEARVGGASAVRRALLRPDGCAELLRGLRRAADAWDPFVWWAAVRAALPADALDGVERSDDLAGEVVRRRRAIGNDPARAGAFFGPVFAPLGDAWTAELDDRDAEALLDEAAALAVATLRPDER
jgi:exonuclease SbcD